MGATFDPAPLNDVLDLADQQALANALAAVLAHGYGQVTIIVDNCRAKFVQVTTTDRLPGRTPQGR